MRKLLLLGFLSFANACSASDLTFMYSDYKDSRADMDLGDSSSDPVLLRQDVSKADIVKNLTRRYPGLVKVLQSGQPRNLQTYIKAQNYKPDTEFIVYESAVDSLSYSLVVILSAFEQTSVLRDSFNKSSMWSLAASDDIVRTLAKLSVVEVQKWRAVVNLTENQVVDLLLLSAQYKNIPVFSEVLAQTPKLDIKDITRLSEVLVKSEMWDGIDSLSRFVDVWPLAMRQAAIQNRVGIFEHATLRHRLRELVDQNVPISPLSLAANYNNLEFIALLVKNGVNLNAFAQNSEIHVGSRVLSGKAIYDAHTTNLWHQSIVYLLDNGAECDITFLDLCLVDALVTERPIEYAIFYLRKGAELGRAASIYADSDWGSILHTIASKTYRDKREKLQLCLSSGISPKTKDANGKFFWELIYNQKERAFFEKLSS